jgi:diguanylate cyclase
MDQNLSLGGVCSRLAFIEKMREGLVRFPRSPQPHSLALISVDRVEFLNDTYDDLTNPTNPQILKAVTDRLRHAVRATDFLFRYGDHELVVVLPKTPLSGATTMAERLHKLVDSTNFYCESFAFKVQLVTAIAPVYPQDTLETILARTGQTLETARERSCKQVRSQSAVQENFEEQ